MEDSQGSLALWRICKGDWRFGGFDFIFWRIRLADDSPFRRDRKEWRTDGHFGLRIEEGGARCVCVCVCAFMCAYVRASECSAHVQYGVLCEILLALPAIEMVEKFGWGQFTHSSKSLFVFACPKGGGASTQQIC